MYVLLPLLFILQEYAGIPDKFKPPQAHCRQIERDVAFESLNQNKIGETRKSRGKKEDMYRLPSGQAISE